MSIPVHLGWKDLLESVGVEIRDRTRHRTNLSTRKDVWCGLIWSGKKRRQLHKMPSMCVREIQTTAYSDKWLVDIAIDLIFVSDLRLLEAFRLTSASPIGFVILIWYHHIRHVQSMQAWWSLHHYITAVPVTLFMMFTTLWRLVCNLFSCLSLNICLFSPLSRPCAWLLSHHASESLYLSAWPCSAF